MKITGKPIRIFLWALHASIVGIGIAVAWTAFTIKPDEEDPTTVAGFFAGMMALCVASLFLLQNTTKIRNSQPSDYWVNLVIGIGLLVSAYFWISGEVGLHPTDRFLTIFVIILGYFAALAAVIMVLLIYLLRPVWECLLDRFSGNHN